MPTTYTARNTILQCGTCDTRVTIPALSANDWPNNIGEREPGWVCDDPSGNGAQPLVTDYFRFIPARGRYTTSCRSCERTARQRGGRTGRAPRSPRVPATTTRLSPARNVLRKFGVELELQFPTNVARDTIVSAIRAAGITSDWAVKSDCSIRGYGWEIVSPPLVGDAGLEEVRLVCQVAKHLGATVDRSCGLHVHHDASDLDHEAVQRFARGWHANQHLTDGLVAPSRRAEMRPTYCQPLSDEFVAAVDAVASRAALSTLGLSRYHAVNLASLGVHGTVEIRQHQGTFDFEKIRSWLLLGQALLDQARAGEVAVASSVCELFDNVGDLLDSAACTFLIGRAVQFDFACVSAPRVAIAA